MWLRLFVGYAAPLPSGLPRVPGFVGPISSFWLPLPRTVWSLEAIRLCWKYFLVSSLPYVPYYPQNNIQHISVNPLFVDTLEKVVNVCV